MKRFRLAIACIGGLVGLAALATPAAPALPPMWDEHSIDVEGQTRWYRVHRPPGAREGAPAVLLLHGGTQSMRKIFRDHAGGTRAWLAIAGREGLVLIVPNGTHRRTADAAGDTQVWRDLREAPHLAGVDDVAFLRQLVVAAARDFALDPARIYVSGASNGGMMTMRLLIEAPQLFAGGAGFIANLPADTARLPRPARPTPIMIVNGTRDALVKWDGGAVGRDRGVTASTRETVAWWVASNGAERQASRREALPDADPADGCRIELEVHAAGPAGAPVWLYTAEGGGHAMPSMAHPLPDSPLVRRFVGTVCRDVEGAELAWRFFQSHAPPKAR